MDIFSFIVGFIVGLGIVGVVIFTSAVWRKNNPYVAAEDPTVIGNVFEISSDSFVIYIQGEVYKRGTLGSSYSCSYRDGYDLVDSFLKSKYSVWLSDYASNKYKSMLIAKKPFSTNLVVDKTLKIGVTVKYL